MGIFDDAIRQHLELKRQRGATESELKQLEDEAFGPPGRPGDADFPDSDESPEQSGNGVAAGPAVPEPEQPPAAPEVALEPSAAEHPVAEPSQEAEPALAEEPPEEPEPTPGSEELTTVFDQTAEREPELDQLEMEPDVGEPQPTEPPADDRDEADQLVEPGEPGGSAEADAPVESLETVEHALPEEETELEESAVEEPPPEPDAEPAPEREAGAEEDDVLADTPDFLRDAPEDDELWFEQGEPKDFDF